MCNAPLSRGAKRPSRHPAQALDAGQDGSIERSSSDPGIIGPKTHTSSGAMVLLLVALCIIEIGLWKLAPGFAVLFLIVIVPALIATFVSLDRKNEAGLEPTFGESIALLLAKVFKTVAILFLVIFGIVIAAGVFCFVLIESGSLRL
jgi:type IV secretory pathway VirB2 component (pilin)